MIRESSGVGIVEFLGYLGNNVPSGVKKQRTCGSLGQNPQTSKIKQRTKDAFNLTALDDII